MAVVTPLSQSRVKTVDEIADELQVHRITIYRLLKSGKIPGFKIGRVWRFDSEQVREWIARSDASSPAHQDAKK
jgi:excisionase family DNA binding protein